MSRQRASVLGSFIDALDWDTAVSLIVNWGHDGRSRFVCICNAHSVVTAKKDEAFAAALHEADLATPDGAPVAWMMRAEGFAGQQRISGPDLMLRVCERAAEEGMPMYFYGSSEHTLLLLRRHLLTRFPQILIAGSHSPPYRALSTEEDKEVVHRINESGAKLVWVSLGCPKQELWMAEHRGRVNGVMLGVGAAFDFHAGLVKRAPRWAQLSGLEWFFRLLAEPRRLWKRYLLTNTAFVLGAGRQLTKRYWSAK